MVRPMLGLCVFALGFGPAVAYAEMACDCRRLVGLCQAEARYDGSRIEFTSQTPQCSRISFSLTDEPAAITIRNGRGSAAMSAPGAATGAVRVEACYVCDVATTE